MAFLPAEIIKKKRNGAILSPPEIDQFISGFTMGSIPDYQMAALLMAIYFQGMNETETLALTKSMLHSGTVVDLAHIPGFKVDKHSTGGVGDKTSLILGPIVAAAGVAVPMISGRGLGHTGGTLDKLESIPGFNTQLTLSQFIEAVEKIKICFAGQTKDICPADKKIYSLRDVTGTVENLSLICASIMSKKLAEGIDGLVLDVKFGSGAFMKNPEKSEELALGLIAIAKGYGKKVVALLTNMDQPLGAFAGNSLEVQECLDILQGTVPASVARRKFYNETRELSLQLSAHMLFIAGSAKDFKSAYELAENTLQSGKAYKKFVELCEVHGGKILELPRPNHSLPVLATQSGYISKMNSEAIGICGILIHAGRSKVTDVIEPTAGIEFHAKIGDQVKIGELLFTFYGADLSLLQANSDRLRATVTISQVQPTVLPLILKVIS